MNKEISALLRCILPCVRFVGDRRESTNQNCSRGVKRLSRFESNIPLFMLIVVISIMFLKQVKIFIEN